MDYEIKSKIAKVLREALKTYTRNQVNNWLSRHLKQALKDAFGEEGVTASIECGRKDAIGDGIKFEARIWGSAFGGDYNDSFYLTSWAIDEFDDPDGEAGWRTVIGKAIDVADCSDYIEREKDEVSLAPVLVEYEAEIRGLETRINELRDLAIDAVKSLPIPKSAKARSGSVYWDKPSSALKEKFPRAFDDKIEEGQPKA